MDSWMAYIPSYESSSSHLMKVPDPYLWMSLTWKFIIPCYQSTSSHLMKVPHPIIWKPSFNLMKSLIASYERHSSHFMKVIHPIWWMSLIPYYERHSSPWISATTMDGVRKVHLEWAACVGSPSKSVSLRTTSNISSVYWPSKQLTH